MKSRIAMLACAALMVGAAGAQAQQEVKVGVLYPLSGPTAQIGIDAVAAIKTAAEIVNEAATSGRLLREVAYEMGVDEDTYNEAMDLRKMAQGNL